MAKKKKARRKPRRSAAQLARDRRRIAELYLEGELQADIAIEVSLSQSTVSNDLKALQNEWLKSALVDFNEAKARELAKIDKLEREYWQAWQRSREDAETVTQEGTSKQVDKVKKTRKGQAGDPRFLQGIQWCVDKRCKIFGLDAATKIDLVDWRSEASQIGLDPADVFERYVQAAYAAISAGDGTTEGGSLAGSHAQDQ